MTDSMEMPYNRLPGKACNGYVSSSSKQLYIIASKGNTEGNFEGISA